MKNNVPPALIGLLITLFYTIPAKADIGYSYELSGLDRNTFNNPQHTLVNESTIPVDIIAVELTVGDQSFNFDSLLPRSLAGFPFSMSEFKFEDSDGTVGYTLQLAGDFDIPHVTLMNTSSTADISAFSVTIGNVLFNYDAVFNVNAGGVPFTLTEPDLNVGGGVRSDAIDLSFGPGFGPGASFGFDTHFDADWNLDKTRDYRNILFNNGTAQSAVVTVEFSNGTVLSMVLPDADFQINGLDLRDFGDPAGNVRSDAIDVDFTVGLAPGGAFQFFTDLDIDSRNTTSDFRSILFNNGSSPNAVLTVSFADGTILSEELQDAQLQGLYSYGQSIEGKEVKVIGEVGTVVTNQLPRQEVAHGRARTYL